MSYWRRETPVELTFEKNVIRFFRDHGKIQVFPRIESGRGIGRGATINLDSMTHEELKELKKAFLETVNLAIRNRVVMKKVKETIREELNKG